MSLALTQLNYSFYPKLCLTLPIPKLDINEHYKNNGEFIDKESKKKHKFAVETIIDFAEA